ncbi:MAG TPA: pseudouridine synthase [Ohtaekwangia sp.]|uniref:RluA family pseudouridine synthase n=1 Tax=Ohtaekwangia sp. TaxID=2066019 RepID=UPI002F950A31
MKPSKINLEELILFEDDDYVLINKPPFVSTLEDRHDKVNLLGLAREYTDDAQVCHRLDKDTSGVLAIAKNPEAYRHMSMQFEKREVTKVYHAIVDGIHNFKDDLVDLPILKQDDGIVKISKREGKPAQTYFTSLQSYKLHTLVECRPVTGRMHQIRIHLATLKASITGDELYGGKPFFLSSVKRGFNLKKQTEEQPIMKRMALHAYALTFADIKGETQTVNAPYPKDMQALIKQLENNI